MKKNKLLSDEMYRQAGKQVDEKLAPMQKVIFDLARKKARMKHKCQEGRSCCCSITALEPDDNCPLHGYPWPPRCVECGRFIFWSKRKRKKK